MTIDDDIPRAALITGATGPLARAIARDLAAAGFAIAAQARSPEEAEATVAAPRAAAAAAVALAADLTREDDAQALIGRAADGLGCPIGLVVGLDGLDSPDGLDGGDGRRREPAPDPADRAAWDALVGRRLRTPFILATALAAALPVAARGAVVLVVDGRLDRPDGARPTQAACVAGTRGLTASLALALAPRLRVNALSLGAARPDAPPGTAEGAADGVAAAIRFLLATPAMTGQTMALAGRPPHAEGRTG
jgi:NAD(P)-dependent dehydrogenase (short-subunit alcohol dehydrogenase family)